MANKSTVTELSDITVQRALASADVDLINKEIFSDAVAKLDASFGVQLVASGVESLALSYPQLEIATCVELPSTAGCLGTANLWVPAGSAEGRAAQEQLTLVHTFHANTSVTVSTSASAVWREPSLLDDGLSVDLALALTDGRTGAKYDLSSLKFTSTSASSFVAASAVESFPPPPPPQNPEDAPQLILNVAVEENSDAQEAAVRLDATLPYRPSFSIRLPHADLSLRSHNRSGTLLGGLSVAAL
eukprot:1670734-Prymnesium_polylepis.1